MNKSSKNYWSVDHRLAYIDFRLRWYGKFNRSDLINRFNISVPQASLDIAKYSETAPSNLEYDRREKAYIRRNTFQSLFPESSSSESFLNALENTDDDEIACTVPSLGRAVDDQITEKIVTAIREDKQVTITYQSMTRGEPTERRILPKNLVFNGSRWHVRAYCFKKLGFRDFLIARILEIQLLQKNLEYVPEDKDWEECVELVIEPASGLTPSQKSIVEYDYNMTNHVLKLRCRRAHLFYILKKYRFLNPWRIPQLQELQLRNLKKIESLLNEKEKQLLSNSNTGE